MSDATMRERPVLRRVELTPIEPRQLQPIDDYDHQQRTRHLPFWRRHWMFLLLVGLPMTLASIYLFGIASDIYVSETKYIVRSAKATDSGLGAFLQNEGMARAVDDTYAVNEYLLSRDAADRLQAKLPLKTFMARPEADIFSRYPGPVFSDTQDRFYKAYRRLVDVTVDGSTGITSLTVYGYRPEDPQIVAQQLLAIGEDFINGLNTRAHRDALVFSERLVAEAQGRMTKIQARIADYRNKQMIVDPEKESSATMVQLGVMATELSRMEANLSQQITLAPKSPSIQPYRVAIRSLRDEMAVLQAKVVGGPNSIVDKLRDFEGLNLEQELAARSLAAATLELEKARRDSMTQLIYLQQIVEPNRPDQPLLPRRILDWFFVLALSMGIFWIVRSFASTAMDHQA